MRNSACAAVFGGPLAAKIALRLSAGGGSIIVGTARTFEEKLTIDFENPNIFQVERDLKSYSKDSFPPVSIRCPHCLHIGAFTAETTGILYQKAANLKGGNIGVAGVEACIRMCPNPSCRGIVLVVQPSHGKVTILPPELIDFDARNLPPNLLRTLNEAIACHAAGAYRASAMMVRRLLEEICDESGAKGRDLHDRLIALKTKITLPEELFEAMGELKALGNDAAHITAKNYTSIGKDESEDSIELAKEILKSRYQSGSPDGWLWTRISALALRRSARLAISRG
ncbi:uncharacterized protein DUF4145 [Gemmobacter caeni]|nr:uncharacterized protein DUF4145 [Gemmobacter caeni]